MLVARRSAEQASHTLLDTPTPTPTLSLSLSPETIAEHDRHVYHFGEHHLDE